MGSSVWISLSRHGMHKVWDKCPSRDLPRQEQICLVGSSPCPQVSETWMVKDVALSQLTPKEHWTTSFTYSSFWQIHVATETSGLEHGLSCDLTTSKGNYIERIPTVLWVIRRRCERKLDKHVHFRSSELHRRAKIFLQTVKPGHYSIQCWASSL